MSPFLFAEDQIRIYQDGDVTKGKIAQTAEEILAAIDGEQLLVCFEGNPGKAFGNYFEYDQRFRFEYEELESVQDLSIVQVDINHNIINFDLLHYMTNGEIVTEDNLYKIEIVSCYP